MPPRQKPVLHSSPGKRGLSDLQNLNMTKGQKFRIIGMRVADLVRSIYTTVSL